MKVPTMGMKGMKMPSLSKPPASIYTHPKDKEPKISGDEFKKGLEMVAEEIAEAFLQKLIENIRENKYGFQIKRETAARRKGGDDTPLINEEYLINSLIREGTMVTVKEGTHPTGVSFLELAMTMEYGRKDKHSPAFPVGRNTFRDFKPTAEKMMKKFLKPKT